MKVDGQVFALFLEEVDCDGTNIYCEGIYYDSDKARCTGQDEIANEGNCVEHFSVQVYRVE